MENDNLQLIAYHESGRVVFTYLSGYSCDAMELPGVGSNTGSKLNAGNDLANVQMVMSVNTSSVTAENVKATIEVAGKLMRIYCAGTCAEAFFQNNGSMPNELAMDMSGQDVVFIEKIQAFLKKVDVNHSEEFPAQSMVSVFKKLQEADIWNAIELLAANILQQESNILTRFQIEDTLMQAGIKVKRQTASQGFVVGIQEDKSKKPAAQDERSNAFELPEISPLDILVKDFLKKFKSDWKEDELNGAVAYLHGVYKKYGE